MSLRLQPSRLAAGIYSLMTCFRVGIRGLSVKATLMNSPSLRQILLMLSIVIAGLASISTVKAANLIINGNFESPAIAAQSFALFNAIPGWTSDSGLGIEIQRSAYPGDNAFDSNQNIEIASAGSESFYQDIPTTPGWQYQLTFEHSARPGVQYNGVSVYWDGGLLDTVDADGSSLSTTNWHLKTYTVVATSTTTRLQFRSFNTSLNPNAGEGGLLDAVTLSPQNYSVLDLGSFGYVDPIARRSQVYVYGLNNQGQAVGDSYGIFGTYIYLNQVDLNYNVHGFRTAPNSPINQSTDDIGSLLAVPYDESHARGINDLGQVVGWSMAGQDNGSSSYTYYHAYRTSGNSSINPNTDSLGAYSIYDFSSLGYIPSGFTPSSLAYAINNKGEVVGVTGSGFYGIGYYDRNAFRTTPNGASNYAMTILSSIYASSANAINNSGQAIGMWVSDYAGGGYYTSPSSASALTTYSLSYYSCNPYGINDSGQVAGGYDGEAFRTSPNSAIQATDSLGSLGHDPDQEGVLGGDNSLAYAINNSGDVVGTSYTDDVYVGFSQHAFVYRSGNLFDLNELVTLPDGVTLTDARAINDKGQIAVNGYVYNDTTTNDNPTRAYVLTLLTPAMNYLQVNSSGLIYNRKTRTFNATLTVTNTASAPIYGPLQLEFTNMTVGATVANTTSTHNGNPYITLYDTVRLMPGTSVSVPVEFTYTGTARLAYKATAYSQGF